MSVFAKAAIVAFTLCAASGIALPMQEDTKTPDSLTVAQRFINAAFPELRGHQLQAQISLGDRFDQDWAQWERGSFSVHGHDPQSPTHSKEILNGRFILTRGRVREAHFEGELVSSALRRKVALTVTTKKKWTAAEMINTFRVAGAKFVDRAESDLLRDIDLARFEGVIGRIVRSSATFVAEPPIRAPQLDDNFEPFWLVTIETNPAPQVSRRYKLEFDPFNVQLITIIESR